MAYNTKAIKTDKDGNPISQYYNPQTDEYEPVEGAGGGNKVILYNEDGTPNNSLSLGEILDKLDQLKGTVIDEETRKQNEQIRQQNEQQRIDLYNTLKDLDVSQYELRLQKLEHDTSVEETVVEEAHGPVILLPENVVNGQINEIKIEGKTYRNILEDYISDSNNWERLNGEIIDNDFIKATADATYKAFWLKAGIIALKPSTQYTIFVEVRKNTLTDGRLVVTSTHLDDSFGVTKAISPGETGIFKFLLTTKSDLTNTLPLRMFIDNTTSGEVEFRVMLLEGDYTNENISYIRGTKSTISAIRLKSVGKNLFDGKWLPVGTRYFPNVLAPFHKGNLENTSGILKPIRVQQGKSYSVSCTGAMLDGIYWYDENGYYINRVFSYINITPPNNAKYMTINIRDITTNIENVKLQIEVNNTTTEYEPYKESTMYLVAKDEEGNILELHSVPNGVKDEIDVSGRKLIKRTKKIIFDGSEKWTEFTTAYADSYGFYRIKIDGWVTQNKAVSSFDTGQAWNDLATFRIVTSIAEGGRPNQIGFHSNGNLYLSLPRDYIDANYSPTLDGMKQYLNDHPITLIYQLAEPIEIPIEVFGNLQSYENGTVYIDTIVSKVNFYDEQEGITVTVPIKAIDTLYKVDKETGYLHPLDISQAVIAEDRLSFTHPDLQDGDLVDIDYVPDIETTRGAFSFTLPTNLKASINNNVKKIGDLSNKVDNLNIRMVAMRENIQDLQNESNEHKEEFNRYKQIYVPTNIVSRPMRYIAHRGASAIAPENTIPAYELAGQLGFWGVEADAIVTKDGVWVALHDTNVERMTNGSGNIQEMTFAEVQNLKIDAGANVNYYPDQKIPTIEEFLNICVKWELVPIIEVKGNMDIENAQSLIELIQAKGLIGKVIISSLQLSHLTTIREINKEVFVEYATFFDSSTIDIIKSLGNAMLSLDYRNVNESVARQCAQNNIILSSYTINDYNIAKSFEQLGISQIYTDILC